MQIKEPIILRTWRGNKNGSILITIPESIKKEYSLEEPTHLILEKHADGIFLRKLIVDGPIQR